MKTISILILVAFLLVYKNNTYAKKSVVWAPHVLECTYYGETLSYGCYCDGNGNGCIENKCP